MSSSESATAPRLVLTPPPTPLAAVNASDTIDGGHTASASEQQQPSTSHIPENPITEEKILAMQREILSCADNTEEALERQVKAQTLANMRQHDSNVALAAQLRLQQAVVAAEAGSDNHFVDQ